MAGEPTGRAQMTPTVQVFLLVMFAAILGVLALAAANAVPV